MLSIDEIKTLMKEMDSSSISELKYESEETKITLRKTSALTEKTVIQPTPVQVAAQPAAAPEVAAKTDSNAAPEQEPSLHKITAPMVGTFFSSPKPDVEAYVRKGSKVDKKTVVCIVEAMKLFNEIEAECKGTIVDILAEDGQLVEYGQPLFLVKED
ncbi:acetyl-CoA carboxylase biotin carboxyl carrier protein [Sporolactobacillus shoreae]|uniref:Biotin carboxyl carrier protein of acetyl-CoA carboxylase n=1 Tax=Sporolactobacillus shoreae TaxID=1465501 RepID=A0A4Z0GK43_9BACL|nr:acetyl-CoA carboxylase biotin carboxyl carrier protein [Sporolactobacillus shoreae]TGA96390.1 acetyl-CoA carboxylase biotin carboxyl carrier protein [Sporolactobacillus shoreae]